MNTTVLFQIYSDNQISYRYCLTICHEYPKIIPLLLHTKLHKIWYDKCVLMSPKFCLKYCDHIILCRPSIVWELRKELLGEISCTWETVMVLKHYWVLGLPLPLSIHVAFSKWKQHKTLKRIEDWTLVPLL